MKVAIIDAPGYRSNMYEVMAMSMKIGDAGDDQPTDFYFGSNGAFSNQAYFTCKTYQHFVPGTRMIFVAPTAKKYRKATLKKLKEKYDDVVYPSVQEPTPYDVTLQQQFMIDTCDRAIVYYKERTNKVLDILFYAEKNCDKVIDFYRETNWFYYWYRYWEPDYLDERIVKKYDASIEDPKYFIRSILYYLHTHKELLKKRQYELLYRKAFRSNESWFVEETNRYHCTREENKNGVLLLMDRDCRMFREKGVELITKEEVDCFLAFYLEYRKTATFP